MPVTIDKPSSDEVVAKIDQFLADISHQTMVTQTDASDFALDLRLILDPPKETNASN